MTTLCCLTHPSAHRCNQAVTYPYFQQQRNLSFDVCGHALPAVDIASAVDGDVLSVFTSSVASARSPDTPIEHSTDALVLTPRGGRAIAFEQYAIVAASTLPARDPSAWVLYAQQQPSAPWVVLDRRARMVFDERTSLQMFSLPPASMAHMPVTAMKFVVIAVANRTAAGCFPAESSCWWAPSAALHVPTWGSGLWRTRLSVAVTAPH